jgi:hypothetical protein
MKRLIAILALFLIIIFFPFQSKFIISNGNTDEIVYLGDLKDYETFYVSFIHSVNRTPVREYYKIVNDKFISYRAEFYSYGAGMSDGSDIPNSKLTHSENGLVELELNDEFEKITYYVGTIANHTLHFIDKELMLSDILEPQSPAVFHIKKVSIYTILRGA